MAMFKIKDWRAARQFPQTYPGDRPEQSYLLLNENIHLLFWEKTDDITTAYFHQAEGRHIKVDEVLKNMGLPTMLERFGVLAYGANRNPATLSIKFRNYHYKSAGKGLAVPVIKGNLCEADVVACNIYGQGYLYADLLYNTEDTANTQVEAWLNLLDGDQLRVMNDSEAVKTGMYAVGVFPGYTIDAAGQALTPLGYAGNSNIFISPEFGKPLAFSTVVAKNRALPEMQPVAMLDHLLNGFKIRDKIAQITGLDNDDALGEELGKYLNGQWWYWFNTREKPIKGYTQVIELLGNCIGKNSQSISTAAYLKERGLILPEDIWYSPGERYTLQGLLDNR